MLAAAQAAAEAAMREAAEREQQAKQQQSTAQPPPSSRQAQHQQPFSATFENEEHMRLLQDLQGGEITQAEQAALLEQMIGMQQMNPENPMMADQLLELLSGQQQQQRPPEQQSHPFSTIPQSGPSQPAQHYLTIAQNGTILEATATVTGFPPHALLMTSAYDAVYDDDLPGFLFIKTQFWDKGHSGVEVYIRRRTIEGDWMWLVSKAVSFVHEPIPGIIVLEEEVEELALARRINRITRIAAILVQAVEASLLNDSSNNNHKSEVASEAGESEANKQGPSSSLTEDAVAYKRLLEAMSATGATLPDNEESLRSLMQIAGTGGASSKGGTFASESKLEKELIENAATAQRRKFDPWSMIEAVRKGVRLDLGLTKLYLDEIKLVTLVLSGKMHVEQVAPLLLTAVQTGQSLLATLSGYHLESEKPSPKQTVVHGSPDKFGLNQSASDLSTSSLSVTPPIAVLNLSYAYIGNSGIDRLSEILYSEGSVLKTLDVSFCRIEDRGFLALARALTRRKKKGMNPLRGLIVSGNYLSKRSAAELGFALSPAEKVRSRSRSRSRKRSRTSSANAGYNTDSESEEEDEDEDFNASRSKSKKHSAPKESAGDDDNDNDNTLQVLHVANTSMTPETLGRLLDGLGPKSLIRELNLSSNNLGAAGAIELVRFLEKTRVSTPMPQLDRIDMSNNNLGDDGTTQFTRAISKRSQVHLVDLRLSSNAIGAGGIETMMNKLLQHNLISLSIDKNSIGDQGCQLVAASLQSMSALSRLNLSFNQIGSRGINSLMRSLVTCESITYLGLSGNILLISGAIALAFTLAQHPRLEELDLDNCCLGQAAQCHIAAGIISNRWVPMKRLNGFAVGPPMVAIGALKPYAQSLSNEECFRIRKDEQMKTILQWMETNRVAKADGNAAALDPDLAAAVGADSQSRRFLTPEFVSTINDIHGTPSQNAYFRLLGWLGKIPFDEEELTTLQKYFYDPDGGEGDRGSDGYINLKLRGDLLAALDSEVADKIRDTLPSLAPNMKGSVGLDLDKMYPYWDAWEAFRGNVLDPPPKIVVEETPDDQDDEEKEGENDKESVPSEMDMSNGLNDDESTEHRGLARSKTSLAKNVSLAKSESVGSTLGKERRMAKVKARITMFPQFEQQLEELKATAMEMIDQEDDPMQHEVILEQYAEASLTILRQLRYHCMNSGLDGWRLAGLKRKILVIDDSFVTRKLVARAFEKANFIVDTASNGAEGVEKLKASIYDIAFMDIDMPVMNGFEATKKLREWEDKMRPGTRQPICALTAQYVDDFERSELMKFKEAGLDVMESKPCNIPRLFKVVDDVSPMFSDLSISVIQRERSDNGLSSASDQE